jgi:hemolysin D
MSGEGETGALPPTLLSGARAIMPALRRLPVLIAGDGKPDPIFGLRRDELDFLPAALEIVERPPSPAPRLIAFTIIAFIVVALLWATFGKVDVVATASGRIVSAGGGKVIQSLEVGRVSSIRVVNGQFVRAGQILLTLEPTKALADHNDIAAQLATAQLQVARLRTVALGEPFRVPAGADPDATQLARREAEAEQAAELARLDGLKGQMAARESDLAVAQAELGRLKALGPVADTRLDIIHKLEAKGYASRLRGLDAETQSRDVANSIIEQQQKLPGGAAALTAARQAHTEALAAFSRQALGELTEAEAKAASLAESLHKASSQLDSMTLRAPVDGVVQEVSVHTIGGVVGSGEPLMRLSPTGSDLEVEAQLENRDVGFLRAGMPADVKIETFPFTRYGTIPARVTSVSGDAMTPPPGAEQHQPTGYSARLKLSRFSVKVDGTVRPLTPGMAVVAEIRIGRRSIIDYLLSPMQRVTSEAGHER